MTCTSRVLTSSRAHRTIRPEPVAHSLLTIPALSSCHTIEIRVLPRHQKGRANSEPTTTYFEPVHYPQSGCRGGELYHYRRALIGNLTGLLLMVHHLVVLHLIFVHSEEDIVFGVVEAGHGTFARFDNRVRGAHACHRFGHRCEVPGRDRSEHG